VPFVAITIDHAVREESNEENLQIKEYLNSQGSTSTAAQSRSNAPYVM